MSSWIKQAFILSLVLNVALLGLFIYFVVRENSLFLPYKPTEGNPASLFDELRKNPDDVVVQSFSKTPAFTLVQTLFARSGEEVSKGMILKLLIEGNQQLLDSFVEKQKEAADFSPAKRQEFLMNYVGMGSKTAAYLLVMLDLEYALLLPNPEVKHLLDLMDEATPEAISFTEEVLAEKRAPEVHDRALKRLAAYTGKSNEELAARYEQYGDNQNLRPLFRQQVPITQTPRTHIVQSGESLWIIAKRYKIDMKKIMVMNNLSSTVLQPGQILKIPFPEND